MSMVHSGVILHVDLSNNKIWKEKLSDDVYRKYLGGRGISARMLWDKVKPGIDPLGPENILIFAPGSLGGTNAPSSGRTTVTCKSPATGRYLKSSAGGHWGAQLKFAGYSHIIFYGVAEKPVYLWVNDDQVEIRDASKLWGLTVSETAKALEAELGTTDFDTASIGPAGENKVKFASIMLSLGSAAGRGGTGAVMGSKNLKTVAVRGTGTLEVADPGTFMETALKARADIAQDGSTQAFYAYGTAAFIEAINAMGVLPVANFRKGKIDGVENVSGPALVNQGYLGARSGCDACAINCHRFSVVPSGPYATKTHGPEYETIAVLGPACGITDFEPILKGASLCNEYGLDTISTGFLIQFATECIERGLLKEEECAGLKFGNADAVIEMIRKIAYREGTGDLLAEGSKIASERLGHDSWKFAPQSRGLEQSSCETRSSKSYALAFCINSRGPDHLFSQPIAEFGMSPEARQLIKDITGDEKYANPLLTDKRAEIVRWHEDAYEVCDSLGICQFTALAAYGLTVGVMAKLFSAGTGINMEEEELMLAGRRVITLERAFNVREGYDRKEDKLPYRLMNEPNELGLTNTQEELDMMMDEYFRLHEWDIKTGIPTKAILEKLDLEDVAEAIGK